MEKLSKILVVIGIFAALAGVIANDVDSIKFSTHFTVLEYFALFCLLFYCFVNFNILKNYSKKRTIQYGASSIFGVIVFFAIIIVVNVIATYNIVRLDFTKESLHSLSDQSLKVLKSLDKEVQITAFFKKNSPSQRIMLDVLDKYKEHTNHLKVEFIDPDMQPGIAKLYKAKEHFTTIFKSGDKEYTIIPKTGEGLEGLITNALIKVTRGKKKNIYFLTDHAENSINDTERVGLSFVKERLLSINYNVKLLSFMASPDMPEDCDVLVVANPKKPLHKNEYTLINEYIKKGGKAIFLVDVDTDSSVLFFLDTFGIHVNKDAIVDLGSKLFGGDFSMPYITDYHKEHAITKDFTLASLFVVARSIAYTRGFESWIQYIPLAKTNYFPNVWAETDFSRVPEYTEGEDLQGPLEVAGILSYDYALESGDKQNSAVDGTGRSVSDAAAEIVIFGDTDFISNGYFNFYGNADFFTNSVNYLAREYDLISISPKKAASSTLILMQTQRDFLFYLSLVIMPLIVLILGIVVWTKRRNL